MRIIIATLVLLAISLGSFTARCATFTWTNTAGGEWSVPVNWSPNSVPGTGDSAVIAGPGTYAVNVSTTDSASVGALTLGGASGAQTLNLAGPLALNSAAASTINTNATVNLIGGVLSGNANIYGLVNWTNGIFGQGNHIFVIETNATVILWAPANTTNLIEQVVTNAGTFVLKGGALRVDYCGGGAYGAFYSLPGATIDFAGDASIGNDGCGSPIVNMGAIEKTGGTGTSFITGTFQTTGTIDAQTGTINIDATAGGSGIFSAETGAAMEFGGGTFTFNGPLISSNATLAGATLAGNGTVSGVLNWTSGVFGAGNNTLTLATNSTLVLSGIKGTNYFIEQPVTNAGTIRIASGNVQVLYCGGGQYGYLVNLPGALIDLANDGSLGADSCSPGIANLGTIRKSGGTGITTISGTFSSTSAVIAQTGTISFTGATTGSGLFAAQTGAALDFSSGTFNLNGTLVSSNTTLAGATLSGNGTIIGNMTWTSGIFGYGNHQLTLATNMTLTLAGTNGDAYSIEQAVTNAGVIQVISGNLEVVYCSGGQYGVLYNLPGALVDIQSNVSIGADTCGAGIVNWGTVRKSGGTGISTVSGPFSSTNLVLAETGALSFTGTTVASNLFVAQSGAALLFSAGTVTLNGNLITSNTTLAGATLFGNGTVTGTMTWTNGIFGQGNYALTLEPGSTLTLAGTNGGSYLIEQTFTNAGTVRVQSGNLQMDYCGGGQYGLFVNLPGALIDLAADVSLGDDSCGSGIVNQGLVRKSAGTGTSDINGIFQNAGTVIALTGAISINGNVAAGGVFATQPGAALSFSSGTFTINGNLVCSNTILSGATLTGNGTISGLITWTSGIFGSGNFALTLATNGTLILDGTNGGSYVIQQAVTNAGTVEIERGNLQINYCGGGQFGVFVNLPGALVDMKTNVSMTDDSCGPGIINDGTIRKSGGTGTNDINGTFLNAGTVDAQTGTISFNGNDTGGGLFAAETGATLAFNSGTLTVAGTLTSSNAVLAGANMSGNGSISGVLNWTSGGIGPGNNHMLIASNGTLVLQGTNGGSYVIDQVVTNEGTVEIESGTLSILYCGGGQYGELINIGLVDLHGNVSMSNDACGPDLVNIGTIRKSSGAGASYVAGALANDGTLDAQTGTLEVVGAYSLAGTSVLNAGLSNLTTFGKIELLNNQAPLSGSISANLINGFAPAIGNSFAVVSYTSSNGVFSSASLPPAYKWSVEYGPATVTLLVTGTNTILPPVATNLTARISGGETLLQFTGSTNSSYTVLATTNIPMPFTNWTVLGKPTATNLNTLQFLDTNKGLFPTRFYIIRSP